MKNAENMKLGLQDLPHYIKAEDMDKVSEITGLHLRTIRRIVWGHTQRSEAIPYLLEIAEMRRDEIRNKVKQFKKENALNNH